MASDRFSRRALRRSLLVSLAMHLIALLLMTVLCQRAGFGSNQSLVLNAETTEDFPEPEILLVSDLLVPPDAEDHPVFDGGDLFASSEGAAGSVSLEPVLPSGADRSDDSAPAEESSPAAAESSGQGALFFGEMAYGDQFVYVVDTSSSMNIGWGKGAGKVSRLIRALAELRESIERLSPSQSFYVILFNGETRRMFDDKATVPRALPATPENKRRLSDWLASIRTGESTDPRPALKLGLSMQPSALFLLSDGIFTGPETSVLEVIKRHNPGHAPIFTIAYEDARSCQAMERIARLTGGEYQFVPHPSVAAAKFAASANAP